MRKLYPDSRYHDGIGYSKNGNEAFLRGERPQFLIKDFKNWKITTPHHIEKGSGRGFRRFLVNFFKFEGE